MPPTRPDASAFEGILAFLRAAESLKRTHRSAYTSLGNPESTAEHTWRLCLMAMVLHPMFPDADLGKLLRICVVHDLGEAISGDIPAPLQGETPNKAAGERADLQTLLAPLAPALRAELLALWDEYEAAHTLEAKLAKAFDKLETILQHNQGSNPETFDYRFNLAYGRKQTDAVPELTALRSLLDEETERRARQADARNSATRPHG